MLFSNSYLNIVVSSAIIYLAITLGMRIFGKKELAQLSVLDLVFILLISNAVQNAMVGSDSTLMGGIVAAITLFLINFIFKLLMYRFQGLKKIMEGEPVLLISKGKIHRKNLRELRMTEEELMEAIREHGVEHLQKVDLAMLEVDGNISVLTDDYKKRSVRKMNLRRRKKSTTTIQT
jgi:uncharacterized membrane protein YcaP (DUF421 family)